MACWIPLLSVLVYLAAFVTPVVAQDAPADVPAEACATLSNSNTYTNVDGERIHGPARCTDGQVPAGASALCRDGSYSFSENRRGTCSGHEGVQQWLR
jgi:hypothetical protein